MHHRLLAFISQYRGRYMAKAIHRLSGTINAAAITIQCVVRGRAWALLEQGALCTLPFFTSFLLSLFSGLDVPLPCSLLPPIAMQVRRAFARRVLRNLKRQQVLDLHQVCLCAGGCVLWCCQKLSHQHRDAECISPRNSPHPPPHTHTHTFSPSPLCNRSPTRLRSVWLQ